MELPPEILEIIFGFCSVTDLLNSVVYVCQQWQQLALSPGVWQDKTLKISGSESAPDLMRLFHQLTFLKSIWIIHVRDQQILLLLCNCCQSVQKLKFSCTDPQMIIKLDSKFPCLTYIDVCFQRNFKLEVAFKSGIPIFPKTLQTVIFRMCTTDGNVPLFILKNCHVLEHLIVSLGYELERFLEELLPNSTQKLKLAKTPGNHNLRILYLSGSLLCDCEILNFVCKSPNLKYLAIKHNLFCDKEALETIFNQENPKLSFLDLSYSFNLSADVTHSVVRTCPNLVYLSLMRCFIGDDALLAIINGLFLLKYLNLHGTLISSQHFHCIPAKLPNLTDLNLCACRKIDCQILTNLIDEMPNLIIVHPRNGCVKGTGAVDRDHPFLEQRNALGNWNELIPM